MRLIIFIICLGLTHNLQAGYLAEALTSSTQGASYWESRAANTRWIEAYQRRSTFIAARPIQQIREALNSGRLELINSLATEDDFLDRWLNAEEKDALSFDESMLENLLNLTEPLEVESYTHLVIPRRDWANLNRNDGFFNSSFLKSHTSLVDAEVALADVPPLPPNYVTVMMKVDGKKGRLLSYLFDTKSSQVIAPKGTYYKIMDKDFDAEQQRFYLSLREVDSADASELPVVQKIVKGKLIRHMPRPNCLP
ncbi:MAG: hypothetical protein ISP86_01765 [Shewanellaceae bacterium]|nr:hypothetical protein [Shewanellaceae bacterium]